MHSKPAPHPPPGSRHPWARALWVAAGYFLVGLGILGIVLPLVPTVPFLLGASYCFYRGSKRLHRWLLDHPLFGGPLKDYLENRGLTIRSKVIALSTLWAAILVSCRWFVPDNLPWAKSAMILVAVAVTVHLVRFKTR